GLPALLLADRADRGAHRGRLALRLGDRHADGVAEHERRFRAALRFAPPQVAYAVGDVVRQLLEQVRLAGVEGAGLGRIDGQHAEGRAVDLRGQRGPRAVAARERRLAPGREGRVGARVADGAGVPAAHRLAGRAAPGRLVAPGKTHRLDVAG